MVHRSNVTGNLFLTWSPILIADYKWPLPIHFTTCLYFPNSTRVLRWIGYLEVSSDLWPFATRAERLKLYDARCHRHMDIRCSPQRVFINWLSLCCQISYTSYQYRFLWWLKPINNWMWADSYFSVWKHKHGNPLTMSHWLFIEPGAQSIVCHCFCVCLCTQLFVYIFCFVFIEGTAYVTSSCDIPPLRWVHNGNTAGC